MDFPGGIVDENPPTNAGDRGLIPGLGRLPRRGAAKPACRSSWPACCDVHAPRASAVREAHRTSQQAQLAATRGSLCAVTEDPAQPERKQLEEESM